MGMCKRSALLHSYFNLYTNPYNFSPIGTVIKLIIIIVIQIHWGHIDKYIPEQHLNGIR